MHTLSAMQHILCHQMGKALSEIKKLFFRLPSHNFVMPAQPSHRGFGEQSLLTQSSPGSSGMHLTTRFMPGKAPSAGPPTAGD